MQFFNNIPKKTLRIGIISLIALILVLTLIFSWFGTFELAKFNARSLTDWRLGGSVSLVRNAEDAKDYDRDGYEWFSDDDGEGIQSTDSNTRYYLGKHPDAGLGGYKVIGFYSGEKYYSVLGIRVGDDELEAKSTLLDLNYKLAGGGFNSCRAEKGRVTVELGFEHGKVTTVAAYLSTTHIFGR